MRRILSLIAGALALVTVLPASTAISGGKPERARIPDSDQIIDFDAGLACSFELLAEPVTNREKTTTFPADANGDQREQISGTLVERLTNVGNGKSITVNISGPVTYIFHSDGSASASTFGQTFLVLYPSDIPAGPSAILFNGSTTFDITPAGDFIVTSTHGHVVKDVCAALS